MGEGLMLVSVKAFIAIWPLAGMMSLLVFPFEALLDKHVVMARFIWLGDEGGESSLIGGAAEPVRSVAVPFGKGLRVAKTALDTCIGVIAADAPVG